MIPVLSQSKEKVIQCFFFERTGIARLTYEDAQEFSEDNDVLAVLPSVMKLGRACAKAGIQPAIPIQDMLSRKLRLNEIFVIEYLHEGLAHSNISVDGQKPTDYWDNIAPVPSSDFSSMSAVSIEKSSTLSTILRWGKEMPESSNYSLWKAIIRIIIEAVIFLCLVLFCFAVYTKYFAHVNEGSFKNKGYSRSEI